MPTYEYRCDNCGKNFDVVQSFHDDPLTECPTCGSPVRKVFGSVGIVFKGSGFYKTDSRSGGSSSTARPSPPRRRRRPAGPGRRLRLRLLDGRFLGVVGHDTGSEAGGGLDRPTRAPSSHDEGLDRPRRRLQRRGGGT